MKDLIRISISDEECIVLSLTLEDRSDNLNEIDELMKFFDNNKGDFELEIRHFSEDTKKD